MTRTQAERQKDYEQRLRDEGYRRLQIWVRKEDADKVKEFAASLREAANK